MKKYFVSYRYQVKNDFGFGNLIRTSLKNKIWFSDIVIWEKEIADKNQLDAVKILNFQEIKG